MKSLFTVGQEIKSPRKTYVILEVSSMGLLVRPTRGKKLSIVPVIFSHIQEWIECINKIGLEHCNTEKARGAVAKMTQFSTTLASFDSINYTFAKYIMSKTMKK